MSIEYSDFYKIYLSKLCPKILGVGVTSKRKRESRIRLLMDEALTTNNKELAQVACDLTADESGSSNLLSEMDSIWRNIKPSEPPHIQREIALKNLK